MLGDYWHGDGSDEMQALFGQERHIVDCNDISRAPEMKRARDGRMDKLRGSTIHTEQRCINPEIRARTVRVYGLVFASYARYLFKSDQTHTRRQAINAKLALSATA